MSKSASVEMEPGGGRGSARRGDGMTALEEMARQLSVPFGRSQMRALWPEDPIEDFPSFLAASRRFGMNALAMEGGYEDLATVDLPLVVTFADGDPGRLSFAVLHAVDSVQAEVTDPRGERLTVSKETFEKRWTGDVIVLSREDEAIALAAAELRRRTGPLPLLLFSLAVLVVGGLLAAAWSGALGAAPSPLGSAGLVAVAIAVLGSFASAAFGARCATCDRAAALVGGLPLGWIGVAAYGVIFGVGCALGTTPWAGAALLGAAGGHAYLVVVLARNRLACPPCLVTAAGVFAAAGVWLSSGISPVLVILVPAGLGAVWGGVRVAQYVVRLRLAANAMRLGREVAAEPRPLGASGATRLVVYRRHGCTPCALFESAYAPGLEETFGESLQLEWRDGSEHFVASPFIVILGPLAVLQAGLPQSEDPFQTLCDLVRLSREGNVGGVPAVEGIFVAK